MNNPTRLPYDLRLKIGKALDRLVCDESTPEQVERFIRTFADFGLVVSPSPVDHVAGATDAERLEDLRLAAKSIRTYMPETLPAGEDGKIHFARALAESAAEAIEAFLATTENKP